MNFYPCTVLHELSLVANMASYRHSTTRKVYQNPNSFSPAWGSGGGGLFAGRFRVVEL